jgi:signal peptidase II
VDRGGRRGAVLLFSVAGLVYIADRLTKLWAEARLVDGPIEVLPGVFTLRFATNPGGAFSLLTSAPWFFAAATLTVSLVIVVTAFRRRSPLQSVALGLILGGALGNLTDRAVRGPGLSGQVVDLFDVHIWPVFNVADSGIVIGAALLAWSSFRDARDAGGRDDPEPDPAMDDPDAHDA